MKWHFGVGLTNCAKEHTEEVERIMVQFASQDFVYWSSSCWPNRNLSSLISVEIWECCSRLTLWHICKTNHIPLSSLVPMKVTKPSRCCQLVKLQKGYEAGKSENMKEDRKDWMYARRVTWQSSLENVCESHCVTASWGRGIWISLPILISFRIISLAKVCCRSVEIL